MIHNVLLIVEGKTEGKAQVFGKGVQNILRDECKLMREQGIRFHTLCKNGKDDLVSNVDFDVRQHLEPQQKWLEKLARQGSLPGDYVYILRDLDCEDETVVRQELYQHINPKYHTKIEIHFAVQEIETWMIADPAGFCAVYRNVSPKLGQDIQNLTPLGKSPESIDCDPMPSTRLERIVNRFYKPYRKTIEGPQALALINPDVVASRCPHFDAFRTSLRQNIDWK